jgi:transcription antitermination factor NusG
MFCKTGTEIALVNSLRQFAKEIQAIVVLQKKYRRANGKLLEIDQIIFPGYVFLRTVHKDLPKLTQNLHVLRILQGSQDDWALIGHNEAFARWVFAHDGVIGASKVYKVGDKVQVHSGPLKDWEGFIVKMDRKRRTGLIEVRFDERVWRVWLAFEWLN